MPTKQLPIDANLEHLKNQAKDLKLAHQTGSIEALQLIREFHPEMNGKSDAEISHSLFKLSDAQLTTARQFGFASWTRIRSHLQAAHRDWLQRPLIERIFDEPFREAVACIDAGDLAGLWSVGRVYPYT